MKVTELERKLAETERKLQRVKAEKKRISYEMQMLRMQRQPVEYRGNDIARLKSVVNQVMGVDIDRRVRIRDVVSARKMYFYWLRNNTTMSYKKMAMTLDTILDHSSIIFCVKAHEDHYTLYKVYRRQYDYICQLMKDGKEVEEPVINAS